MAFCIVNLTQGPLPDLKDPRLVLDFPSRLQPNVTTVVTSTLAIVFDNIRKQSSTDQLNHIVVCIQRKQHEEILFASKLWEGKNEEEAMYAFSQLLITLEPIMQESLRLNEELLKEAILPSPMTPSELCVHLVDIMESRPNIYFEWHHMMRALLQYCDVSLETLKHPRQKLKHLLEVTVEQSRNEKEAEESNTHSPYNNRNSTIFDEFDGDYGRSRLLTRSSEYYSAIGSPVQMEATFEGDGNTPLMLAISRGYVRSSMYLLLAGVDPNEAHPANGDTALHMAIEHDHFDIVKLLLIFDANPMALNNNKERPVDKASLSSVEMYESLLKEIDFLKVVSKPPLVPENVTDLPPKSLAVLSLDGGGVKALNMILILIAIEIRMKQLDPQCDKSILHFFDYIAGSSGGSFIPLICLYGKLSLQNYFALQISGITQKLTSTKEKGKNLESLLKTGVGADTVMGDLKHPRIIVTTTIADHIPSTLHLMTNYGESRNGQKGPNERKVWEAGRMSSAAPVYFEPFEGKFLDGSIMANNPTLTAMSEIINEEGMHCNLKLVLSLGTGVPPPIPIDKINIVPPTLSFNTLLNIPGSISSAKNILNLGFNQLLESDGHEVAKAQSFSQLFGAEYYRLSPPLTEVVNIMETNLSTIINMLYDCYLYRLRKVTEIDSIARLLLQKQKQICY